MAGKRKAISKTLRFEVFKRDGFRCQYCGAHPPEVVLQVDHIQPVAAGGQNGIDNLLTACQPCNLGKSARSLQIVPQSLADKAAEVAEREEQIRGYQEVMSARMDRIEAEAWRVADCLTPGSSVDGMNRDKFASLKRFVERLGLYEAMDAAEIAAAAVRGSEDRRWRYFCGVCWNKVRAQEGGGNA